MRILFDHQAFTLQTYGGVSRCFVELYNHLPKDVKATISLRESNNAYCSERGIGHSIDYDYYHFIFPFHWPAKGRMFRAYNRIIGRGGNYQNKWEYNKRESIRLLKEGDFDIFHPTYFDDYFLPYLNGKPFVLTIHDMIPELYPQYFKRDDFQIRMRQELVPLASAIVAVSETTKQDVVRILGVPEEKVHVIYHGCSLPTVQVNKPICDFPYILFVGARWDYKNFTPFVENIATFLKRNKEVFVVCTGGPFSIKEQELLDENGVRSQFIHQWVKDDIELYSLYHHAICLAYPSEYEGFGIPILEAYKADCPVMLNRASCFPEIAGDAAIYFEMTSEHSNFSEQLEMALRMTSDERNDLLKKQRERLTLYSWEKSAKELAEVYQSIV